MHMKKKNVARSEKMLERIIDSNLDEYSYLKETMKELNKYRSFICENKEELLRWVTSIKKDQLYSSIIHGLYHSEKVFMYSFILAKKLGLSQDECEILLDAALYHDCGRIHNAEESFHGYVSAIKVEEERILSDKPIYKNNDNFRLLQAIIDIHSQNDNRERINFDNYELPEEMYPVYTKLYSILKDADALDRKRFYDSSVESLDPRFLRFKESHELIDFAKHLNILYYQMLKENYKKVDESSISPYSCFHSIGFDFFKIASIMKNGILSKDEMRKRGIEVPQNFSGGNTERWISVVDTKLLEGDYTAKKAFLLHGISFCCDNQIMHEPLPREKHEYAMIYGFPYNRSNHKDEKYVLNCIEPENIIAMSIPEEYKNSDVRNLSYLYNAMDVSVIKEKVDYYINIICPDQREIVLNSLQKYFDEYDKVTRDYYAVYRENEEHSQKELEKNLNNILSSINKVVAYLIYHYYQERNLSSNGTITVSDVVKYELQQLGIDFNFYNSADVTIVINSYINNADKNISKKL